MCWWAGAALTSDLHTGRPAMRGDRIVRGTNFDRLPSDGATTDLGGALRFTRDSSTPDRGGGGAVLVMVVVLVTVGAQVSAGRVAALRGGGVV